MPCMLCDAPAFSHLCQSCRSAYITPIPKWRSLENGLKVLSFFSYDEIDVLLKTKHSYRGFYIYNILAKATFRTLGKQLNLDRKIAAVAVDDLPEHGYSHTALLAQALKSRQISVKAHTLIAKNRTSYAGKELAFRQSHPRNFSLHKKPDRPILLVDDIVTTGTTLIQAQNCCEDAGAEVLMAVVLADASR